MFKPLATQSLSPTGRVIRRAYCGPHYKWSSNFQGVDVHGWLFKCTNMKVSHRFYAQPDRSVPQPGQEQAWIAGQKALRIQNR